MRDYRRYLCSVPAPADSKQVQQELDNYIELTRMETKNAQEAAAAKEREKAAAGAQSKYGGSGSTGAQNPYNHPHTQPRAPPQKGSDAYSRFTKHWFDEDEFYDHKAPPNKSGSGGAAAGGSTKGSSSSNPFNEVRNSSTATIVCLVIDYSFVLVLCEV